MSDPVAKAALRNQEEATNRAKEEALVSYNTPHINNTHSVSRLC